MGQRHQLFVIAKINGRYRCLCTIHHQWLYGQTALRRCLDTLKIFGDAANGMPIQQELIAASKHDDSFWVAATRDEYYKKNSHVPFPFIATCLTVGASFNVKGYYHGTSIMSFYMAFDEGDNNNGITIFDITDLNNVRYCFVDFHGMESEREVELMTPLTARTYLEAYHELDKPEKAGMIQLVDTFNSFELVTVSALKETWPRGSWKGDDSFEAKDEDNHEDDTKTLRDRSLETLFDNIMDLSHEDYDLVTEAETLTDFAPKLRRKLYDKAGDLQGSTYVLDLLHKALEMDTEVDLSPFKTLKVEFLSALVSRLRHSGGSRMRVLNLSGMPLLTESDLALMLGDGPTLPTETVSTSPPSMGSNELTGNLKGVILLEDPQISVEFLAKNLGHYELFHSELLRRPFNDVQASHHQNTCIPLLEFAAPNTVSQLVWVGVTGTQSCDRKLRLDNAQFDWSGLKYSQKASNAFDTDDGLKYRNFLLDVPLPAGKTIHALQRLLQYLGSPNIGWFDDWPKAAARCFATTALYNERSEHSVGPLSTNLFLDEDDHNEIYVGSGKGKQLKLGQWAIILVHEAYDVKSQEKLDRQEQKVSDQLKAEGAAPFKAVKSLRYAFVKLLPGSGSSEKHFLATDVQGFLGHVFNDPDGNSSEVKNLNAWWQKESSALGEGVSHYGEEDIHDILRKVYSDEPAGENGDGPSSRMDPFQSILKLMSLAQRDESGNA